MKQIDIPYGRGAVSVQTDPKLAHWDVIRPSFEPALEDPKQLFHKAVRDPIGTKPLREIVKSSDRVVIATSDGTRPVPNKQLIPWLLEELSVSPDQVTVLIGTGTHRPNTKREIVEMFGKEMVRRVRIVNHDAFSETQNEQVGKTADGTTVFLNKEYLNADIRIALGFIEPHFFAGFSGGPKAVAPGVASIETIFRLHRAELIADPNSTYGVLHENPLHREIRECVALCPPDFLLNVTLNAEKKISGYYAGDLSLAHAKGCADVKASAMVPVETPFPLVVTSNSGFPLDQNLYQTVKGISGRSAYSNRRRHHPGGQCVQRWRARPRQFRGIDAGRPYTCRRDRIGLCARTNPRPVAGANSIGHFRPRKRKSLYRDGQRRGLRLQTTGHTRPQ